MKIKLGLREPELSGDITALSILEYFLEQVKDGKIQSSWLDAHRIEVLTLWWEYLRNIGADLVSSNYQQRSRKVFYTFAFAKDYAKNYPEFRKLLK